MKITVEDILKNACSHWHEDRILEISGGVRECTLLEFLAWPRVPASDLIWQAVHLLSLDVTIEVIDRLLVKAVSDCVLGCGVEELDVWAKFWISGDRTESALREASKIACEQGAVNIFRVLTNAEDFLDLLRYAEEEPHEMWCLALEISFLGGWDPILETFRTVLKEREIS